MRTNKRFFCIVLLMFSSLVALPVWAHSPHCQCKLEGGFIVCQGGFSDGSGAEGIQLDVITYDEDIILSSALDGQSSIRFPRPDGDFYILMDAGPGHIVEIDWPEIEGIES
ncbi:hypothetical protein DN062_04405 [Nitrincola tibetensis]|uniref:Carboxypeptidase regulatory-like domain-containing protein n=1 Tax=Nitrincola tibetensis TaxID=2219697 RepID=A0A364NNR1_9GAMM|nr:hypothetical protein [Nitrincola tibetensis]RAU18736.1 hypothetical protein DN062_04405 [Nitrincola tibetensis]